VNQSLPRYLTIEEAAEHYRATPDTLRSGGISGAARWPSSPAPRSCTRSKRSPGTTPTGPRVTATTEPRPRGRRWAVPPGGTR
jgi:hypothetical protein